MLFQLGNRFFLLKQGSLKVLVAPRANVQKMSEPLKVYIPSIYQSELGESEYFKVFENLPDNSLKYLFSFKM